MGQQWDVIFNYQLIVSSEESGRANHHALFGLSIDITDSIDLDVNMYFDRTEEPQPDDIGVIPKKNDYRLAVGLSWDL